MMPFRGLNKFLYRLLQEILARYAQPMPKSIPKFAARAIKNISHTKANKTPFIRKLIITNIRRSVRTGQFVRPFATFRSYQLRAKELKDSTLNKRGLLSLQKARVQHDVIDRVKVLFGTNARYNQSLNLKEMPRSLAGYEIGQYISHGSNAAVYELRKKSSCENEMDVIYRDFQEQDPLKKFPLAIKMMFNTQFGRPDYKLWREMGSELIPIPSNELPKEALLYGKFSTCVSQRHPNLIKMHTAFIDIMPILPDAKYHYPAWLPIQRSSDMGMGLFLSGDPTTLFVVMKRYRVNLQCYLYTHKLNFSIGCVLFGQLLEAIVFLQRCKISHRDMKSDNILLDYDFEDEIPHLVLSDFGCAHFFDSSNGWRLPYQSADVDLGGNQVLRAPEIRRAKPGVGVFIDYQKSDAWAAATLGYEIFTRVNPFYSQLSGETYTEDDLPPLPLGLPSVISQLIPHMLRINPVERPFPEIAANVVCISLFRFGKDIQQQLKQYCLNLMANFSHFKDSIGSMPKMITSRIEKKTDDFIELYAAETMLSKLIDPRIISRAELQLRATFLSRLDRSELYDTFPYFITNSEPNADSPV